MTMTAAATPGSLLHPLKVLLQLSVYFTLLCSVQRDLSVNAINVNARALNDAETRAVTEYDSRSGGFKLEEHLGNLSPYGKKEWGVVEELPGDCKVEQVMLMHRHGSRYPLSSELVFITNLVNKLNNHSATIQTLNSLPSNLKFLQKGYTSTLGHDDLTGPGRMQLFDHGVQFKLRYPGLEVSPNSILVGFQDRVIESAQWFAQGYFGRSWAGLNSTYFTTIPEDNVTQSWITPMTTCKKWQYAYGNNATIAWGTVYLPPIAKRFNKLLPGVNFTTDDVHGALYACAYDLAAHGASPWCGAFTEEEIKDFEFELDLLMDGAFGYNLPDVMGPTLGALYVNKLIERFTNASGSAIPLYLEFGHDTTIDLALTALGLAKDTPPLSAKGPVRPNRKWRTSLEVPFGAQMTWEKFTCSKSITPRDTPQIRLLLNGSPYPLSQCKRMNPTFGSCALDDFVSVNAASQKVSWRNAAWNATCGA